jgi:hypothetical protein
MKVALLRHGRKAVYARQRNDRREYVSTLVDRVQQRSKNVSTLVGLLAFELEKHQYVLEEQGHQLDAVGFPLQLALVDQLSTSQVQVFVLSQQWRFHTILVELFGVNARLNLVGALAVLTYGHCFVHMLRYLVACVHAFVELLAVLVVHGVLGQLAEQELVFDQALHFGGYEVFQVQLATYLIVLGAAQKRREPVVLHFRLKQIHCLALVLTKGGTSVLKLLALFAFELFEHQVDELFDGNYGVFVFQSFQFAVELS